MNEQLYVRTAAAFVRGRYAQGVSLRLTSSQTQASLDDLADTELVDIIEAGRQVDLRIHKFKRTMGLPRVRRVLGVLRQIAPSELLDVGSGRGVFLWPVLDEFPNLPVAAIDQDSQSANDLETVRLGGVERLTSYQMDVSQLAFDDNSFDVATLLEVLEHLPEPRKALAEMVRVVQRFVVLSVPSKPDDNPQHIHLFSENDLRAIFADLGVQRVTFDYVTGHMIAVANVGA